MDLPKIFSDMETTKGAFFRERSKTYQTFVILPNESMKRAQIQIFVIPVAAHLRGMRLAPTSQKDTLMLWKNSNTNIINETLDYVLLDYFYKLYIYTDTYLIRILNNVHIYWYIFIRNQTDPD